MRGIAFAAITVALAPAPVAAQIAVQATPNNLPQCEAVEGAQFRISRVADLGAISGDPHIFKTASRLAIHTADGAVALLDSTTGARIADLFPAGGYASLEKTSPNGESAVWRAAGGAAELRRVTTGELIVQLGALQQDQMLFSPDGSRLAVEIGNNLVLLDTNTGKPVAGQQEITSLADASFSADGKRLIVDGRSRDLSIDIATGQAAYPAASDSYIEFDRQGLRALHIADAGWKLVDPASGGELAKGPREDVSFVGGGAYVRADNATAGPLIFDAATGRLAVRPGKLARDSYPGVAEFGIQISPDRRTAITRAPDGRARLWDLVRGRGLAELGIFSSDGVREETLLALDQDDARDLDGAALPNGEFRFTPDGGRLITLDPAGWLRTWDTRTGMRVATIGQVSAHDRVWLAEDGAFALIVTPDGATLWNTRSGWRIAAVGEFAPDKTKVRFSPDRRLMMISDGSKTELWNVDRGAKVAANFAPEAIDTARFSGNGAWLVLRPNAGEAAFELRNALTGGRAGEARPADEASFHVLARQDVLLTRSATVFSLWDMKRGQRSVSCQFSDPNLSMMDVFETDEALLLVLNVGAGLSELWRIETAPPAN